MNRTVLFIGLFIAAAVIGVLFLGLGKDPQHIESPLVGRTAPDFALKVVGAAGMIDLQQLRGKPVIINFWATWCVPCWQEHPVLVANARALQPNVQFLGVVFQDDETKILNFLRDRGNAYPTLIDEKGKTAIAYGVGGVPETFFLDSNGTIVAKYDGPMTPEILQSYLAKAWRQ
jgi:cytochrome c biogenesis protein CcmG/thiol:disulfide interchange protein DsbE